MSQPSDNKPSSIIPEETADAPLETGTLFPAAGRPLEIDLGCGMGRFLLARAAAFPGVNFVGIDRQQKRLRKVDRKIAAAGLSNVRLLRSEAAEAMEKLFPAGSVAAVYVFFPDPWPKRRHHRRRLFSGVFADSLHRILAPGGLVHVATDHLDYFDFINEIFRADPRFETIPAISLPDEQRTDFEMDFLNQGLEIGRGSYRKKQTGS